MKKYRVVAVWPDGVLPRHTGNVTKDEFMWEWQATAMSTLYFLEGWGGDFTIFPERMWIEDFEENFL